MADIINVLNFLTDFCVICYDSHYDSDNPHWGYDYTSGHFARFNEEQEDYDLMSLEDSIADCDDKYGRKPYEYYWNMRKAVRYRLAPYIGYLRLGHFDEGYLMKVILGEDFAELLFTLGEGYGYDYAVKPLDAIHRSAHKNGFRLGLSEDAIYVYENE
jgi:hypothetical protein